MVTQPRYTAQHRKTQMSHLTHLSHSGSVHGQTDSKICKNESFCPCSDPLWLKWVKWLIWVFLCYTAILVVCTLNSYNLGVFLTISIKITSSNIIYPLSNNLTEKRDKPDSFSTYWVIYFFFSPKTSCTRQRLCTDLVGLMGWCSRARYNLRDWEVRCYIWAVVQGWRISGRRGYWRPSFLVIGEYVVCFLLKEPRVMLRLI